MKKILSVDFDYFQDVQPEVLQSCYPDGLDLETELSTLVWSGHYSMSHQKEQLMKVGILEKEFERLIDLLMEQSAEIPVMIANSHLNIYGFIHNHAEESEPISLTNVDMHHDMINQNPDLDCGNWIRFINQEYQCDTLWIANPISKSVYGLTEDDLSDNRISLNRLIPESLDCIMKKQFDMFFLCRSDNWFPPHLDKYFEMLCQSVQEHFHHVVMETGISKPRDYQTYVRQNEMFLCQLHENTKR